MTLQDTVKELCKERGISVNRFEQEAGLAKGYVSKLAKTQPNTATIKKMADYFGISVSQMIDYQYHHSGEQPKQISSEEISNQIAMLQASIEQRYLLDAEATQLAQAMKDNEQLHALFDAAKDASPEDLKTVYDMLLLLKQRGKNAD